VVSWAVPGFSEQRELGIGGSRRVVAVIRVADGQRVVIKYHRAVHSGAVQGEGSR
jgi:hypothetical protein